MHDAGGVTSGELTFMRRIAPFVGRRQHLQWFERSLQEVSAGHPQVILIQGEAGLGKTRLLTEMRPMAMHRGVRVYASRCYEDLALPYLPFIEALRPHLDLLPRDVEHVLTTEKVRVAGPTKTMSTSWNSITW